MGRDTVEAGLELVIPAPPVIEAPVLGRAPEAAVAGLEEAAGGSEVTASASSAMILVPTNFTTF